MPIPEPQPALRIAFFWRPIPARSGEDHIVSSLLRSRGHHVDQTVDRDFDPVAYDAVILLENSGWFPQALRSFAKPSQTVLAVWHWEPLPLPKAAGVPQPKLSVREMAKIVLRDRRATDVYTNLRHLKRLTKLPRQPLLLVSSQAWRDSLAENGIAAEWVPYGYEPADGMQLEDGGERDIDALFLGALEIPRRRAAMRELRRAGVKLEAHGSWFQKSLWGEERNKLIQRSQAFLNIQRYAGEIGAHRMILGMANRSLVISEPVFNPAPFRPGHHYIEATLREMPDVLRYYREHREERDRIVEEGFRLVTQDLRMEQSVERILTLIEKRRAEL